MPSRADTLTLVIRAITEARSTLQDAYDVQCHGHSTRSPDERVLVLRAVLVLEHQAARLRRSFKIPPD